MWETKASELFTKAVNELTTNGWTAKRITDLTYELTDAAGTISLGTCYVEQLSGVERYSIFLKISDDLAGIGTVAVNENGLYQSYDLDGNIYTAAKECYVCKSKKDLYATTPGSGAYIVRTFCERCLDAADNVKCDNFIVELLDADADELNYCSTCGDFASLIKGDCYKCATAARNERDSWEKSNVCSRCEGKLDQQAIEIDSKAVCAACQTTTDFII